MKISFEKGELVIRVPVTDATIKKAPLSNSGKTKLLASTAGFQQVEDAPAGVKLNLTLIAPKE